MLFLAAATARGRLCLVACRRGPVPSSETSCRTEGRKYGGLAGPGAIASSLASPGSIALSGHVSSVAWLSKLSSKSDKSNIANLGIIVRHLGGA